LGSLFFNLVTGRYLFNGINKEQILSRNRKCDLSMIPDYLNEVSEPCRDLIMWMLDSDPGNRPSAKDALMHSWFKNDSEIIKELL
jgi:serine/threonine protein kinase